MYPDLSSKLNPFSNNIYQNVFKAIIFVLINSIHILLLCTHGRLRDAFLSVTSLLLDDAKFIMEKI